MIKNNGEKGITLVALIITVIVLLILAMVSINLVINSGIITKSKSAVDEYSDEEISEQINLAYSEYQMQRFTDETQQTLTDFLHSKLDTMYENMDISGTDPLIINIINGEKTYAFRLSSNGSIEQLIWVQNRTTVTNTKTGQILEVGDTVYYDSGVAAYEGEEIQGKWGILGAEDGKLLIMSKETVATVTLNGKQDYLTEGPTKLNNVCSAFKNETYADSARSIKVEDINRITGYTISPKTYTYTLVDGYVKRNDKAKPSSKTYFEDVYGTQLTENNSINVTNNYYTYALTDYFTSDSKTYNLLKNNDNRYWLNSSYAESRAESTYWGYYGMFESGIYRSDLWGSNGSASGHGHKVRAVISLKSNINLSGSNTSGWTIN